jgi:2-alkyl-3-oxoalkanoate reductase
MKVLVTGASGFLGSHVAEQLKRQGHSVRCLVRKSSNRTFLDKLGVELAFGAVDAPESLPEAVQGVDAVVHSAGLVKARNAVEFDRVNHQGTRALLQAAVDHAPGLRRFVHVSSAAVMGPCIDGRAHRCEDEPRPVTEYGRSKLAAEKAVQDFKDKLNVTILRPPAIYGPRDQEILAFFKMVKLGLAIKLGDGLKTLSMVYGPDCAAACVCAIDAEVPSGATFFVEDGHAWTFNQMADAIASALEVETWARPKIPVSILKLAAGVSEQFGRWTDRPVMFNRDKLNELTIEHFVCDATDAKAKLGWQPTVPFPEGAKMTARWYLENNWL